MRFYRDKGYGLLIKFAEIEETVTSTKDIRIREELKRYLGDPTFINAYRCGLLSTDEKRSWESVHKGRKCELLNRI